MRKSKSKSGSNNPNWRGGISKLTSADQLLTMPEVAQRIIKEKLTNYKVCKKTKCHNWTGGTFPNGRANLRNVLVYRLVWVLKFGAIGDLLVCHTCDNGLCINPKHLFLGTNQDNSTDMVKKNRSATGDRNGSRLYPERLARGDANYAHRHPEIRQGENNGRAQLTEAQVLEIRAKYTPYINCRKPSNQAQLALEYGVSTGIIYNIVHRKTWRHI